MEPLEKEAQSDPCSDGIEKVTGVGGESCLSSSPGEPEAKIDKSQPIPTGYDHQLYGLQRDPCSDCVEKVTGVGGESCLDCEYASR